MVGVKANRKAFTINRNWGLLMQKKQRRSRRDLMKEPKSPVVVQVSWEE